MTRLLIALFGVLLLAVTALALVWLAGQLLVVLGALVVGTAGLLGRLLWYLLVTGALAGVVFFVASAWRPAPRSLGSAAPLERAGLPRSAAVANTGQANQAVAPASEAGPLSKH